MNKLIQIFHEVFPSVLKRDEFSIPNRDSRSRVDFIFLYLVFVKIVKIVSFKIVFLQRFEFIIHLKEVTDGVLYLEIYTCYEANFCDIRNFCDIPNFLKFFCSKLVLFIFLEWNRYEIDIFFRNRAVFWELYILQIFYRIINISIYVMLFCYAIRKNK